MEAQELIDEARRHTCLEDFGGEGFREGLGILIADIASDAQRSAQCLADNRASIQKALCDRLLVIDAWKQDEAIGSAPVERPVFVLGMPRTGTTMLSNLLAVDPDRRPLLAWELEHPVPPPTAQGLYSDPRALDMLDAARRRLAANPASGRFFRGSPVYPHEDVYVHGHDFKTLMWEAHGTLRDYRDWLFQTDLTSAYEYQKKFLQLHQSLAPGIWSLKMPSHALFIPTLLKVFPDARLIWTHRDPYAATGSYCSLARLSHRRFTGRVDMAWIAENQPWQAAQHLNRAMDARDQLGEQRLIDVHYAQMLRDPLATMRKLYRALGDDFTPQAEHRMRAWLAENPPDKFGKHEYGLEEFGLSKAKLAPLFERYLARYDIEPEVAK